MTADSSQRLRDLLTVEDQAAPVLVTDTLGKLHYREEPVSLTRFDRSYVAAAAAAQQQNRDIALIYPSAPTYLQLTVLLAIGYQTRSMPPTLFISNRSGAGIRDQYFNVGTGESLPSAPVNSLADATAPMVKTGDGQKLSYITNHKPRNWNGDYEGVSVVHSTLGKKIAGEFPTREELPLSSIVLDVTSKLLSDFDVIEQYQEAAAERNIPLIYLFDSPSHPHLERLEDQNATLSPESQTLFWGLSQLVLEEGGVDLLHSMADRSKFEPESITAESADPTSPFEASLPALQNLIRGVDREIANLTYSDLQPVADRASEKISEVSWYVARQTESEPRSVSRMMRDLYFTYNYLSALPTSVEFHDDMMAFDSGWGSGSTVDQMIENVRGNYAQLEQDVTGAGNMLDDACQALSAMVSELTERNPKADTIVEEIKEAVDREESLVVLTATKRQTSLLRSFVTEQGGVRGQELHEAGVDFHPAYSTHTIPQADRLLFPGVPSKSHRPAVLSGGASTQTYLTYEWEVDRLEYWLDELQAIAEYRCGPGMMKHTAEQLDVDYSGLADLISLPDTGHAPVPRSSDEQQSMNGEEGVEEDGIAKTTKRRVGSDTATSVGASDSAAEEANTIDPDSFTPDGDAFKKAGEHFDDGSKQETVNAGREDTGGSSRGSVEAVRIELSGGVHIFEKPDGRVWVYDEQQTGKRRRTRKSARALEQGDTVLITEQESRRDLFEHIVEKIRSEVPEFKRYSKMLEFWRSNLERTVNEEDLNPRQIEYALQEYADEHDEPEVTRTYHAVRDWITGDGIGPSDARVIKALGEIYDIDIYKEMASEIEASLDEIRNLHRQVGRQLEKIVFDAGSGESSDEWLFEELNIRVGDIQDAVEYRSVESVSEDTIEVDSYDLGRLFNSS